MVKGDNALPSPGFLLKDKTPDTRVPGAQVATSAVDFFFERWVPVDGRYSTRYTSTESSQSICMPQRTGSTFLLAVRAWYRTSCRPDYNANTSQPEKIPGRQSCMSCCAAAAAALAPSAM